MSALRRCITKYRMVISGVIFSNASNSSFVSVISAA